MLFFGAKVITNGYYRLQEYAFPMVTVATYQPVIIRLIVSLKLVMYGRPPLGGS